MTILGVSLQKNNNKVSEGMTDAVGHLVDFQLVLITLDKMMILSCLWMF